MRSDAGDQSQAILVSGSNVNVQLKWIVQHARRSNVVAEFLHTEVSL